MAGKAIQSSIQSFKDIAQDFLIVGNRLISGI
jgi:hypothetical protein